MTQDYARAIQKERRTLIKATEKAKDLTYVQGLTLIRCTPNQIALIRSGAWILIPNEHTDQDTSDVSSKTDQDTDQET